MKTLIFAGFVALATALPVAAQDAAGDAEAGAKEFRKCKACHMIEGPDGSIVKGGRTGPNLYGIAGRPAGSFEGFRYSDLMLAAGDKGLEWNEADFVGYVQDPTSWLQDYTGETGRAKMTFKVRNAEDAMNLWAYLASVAPAEQN